MTRVEVFGQLGAEATNFPDQITVAIKPADPKTNAFIGGIYRLEPESWLKVCQKYRVPEDYRIEAEGYFKNGESVNLGFKTIYLDMDDDQLRDYQARTSGNS